MRLGMPCMHDIKPKGDVGEEDDAMDLVPLPLHVLTLCSCPLLRILLWMRESSNSNFFVNDIRVENIVNWNHETVTHYRPITNVRSDVDRTISGQESKLVAQYSLDHYEAVPSSDEDGDHVLLVCSCTEL